ncbi:hypothetical protein ISN75_00030 [Dyella marensis]
MAKQVAVVRYLRDWNAATDYVYGLTRAASSANDGVDIEHMAELMQ